jgi:hypothetical protein
MKTPGDYLYRTPRPTRHPGRVAAACFLAAGLLMLAADRACADEFVALAGYGTTSGLGERTGAPEASLSYLSRHVALEGSWYGAAKLESGAGFGVRGAAEARWQGLGAGLAYSYRDGGAWSKAAPWARVSAGAGPVRLIGEAALGGRNRERKVEARVTGRAGRFVLEPRVFVESHLQGTGWGAALLVGLALDGAR